MKKLIYLFVLGIGFTSCSVESLDSTENLLTADAKTGLNANNESNKPTLEIPSLTLVEATKTSLTIKVTAGTTGAPHGIWLFASENESDFASEDWKNLVCELNYNDTGNNTENEIAPYGIVTFTFESLCLGEENEIILDCGKNYYFKAEARPGKNGHKSGVAAEATAFSTAPCQVVCAKGKGYWTNHGPVNPGNQENAYPEGGVVIGNTYYSLAQLQEILQEKGNTGNVFKMKQHLITVILNITNGVDGSSMNEVIATANNIIIANGDGYSAEYIADIKDALEAFNTENACEDFEE